MQSFLTLFAGTAAHLTKPSRSVPMNRIVYPYSFAPLFRWLGVVLLVLGLAAPGARGQHLCGTSNPTPAQYEEAKATMIRLKAQFAGKAANELIWVPLRIHVVRKSNGTFNAADVITTASINTALFYANRKFLPANIQFFILGNGTGAVDWIDNNGLYAKTYFDGNNDDFVNEQTLASSRDVRNALNIYYVASIRDASGYGKFPVAGNFPRSDTNVTPMSIAADNLINSRLFLSPGTAQPFHNYTLAHELGHMFNLFHTFATVGGVERAIPIGSSCLNEGDGICETNADPWGRGMGDLASFNAGGVAVQKNGCGLTYVGQLRDPANYLYTRPLPLDNQMSYYYGYFINEQCGNFRFVTEQNDKSILFARERQGWTNANLSGRPSITMAPVLTTTSQLGRYTLSWPKLTGALGYIVERSTNPTFTSYEVIAGLDANATSYTDNEVSSAGSTVYYYRIRASNSTAYSCPGAITPALIVNSTPLSSTTVTNRWWGDYAKKATKWGFMANSQFPANGNLPTLTASDAANVVVRAAKSLGFTAYQLLTFSCGEESNAAFYYLRSRGIIPSLLLANQHNHPRTIEQYDWGRYFER